MSTNKGVTKFVRDTKYREAFLATLTTKLAAPSESWPTTRFWTPSSLRYLFRETRDELGAQKIRSQLSNKSLLEWLAQINVSREVVAVGERFQVFGLAKTDAVDPYELLMASRPKGVICYFSALAFHSLTTQPIPHHHVAVLKPSIVSENTARQPKQTVPQSAPKPTVRKMGRLLFTYEGTPFFETTRSSRLIPGVQTWAHGPRTNLRIAAYEQSLIDALYKPFHCGGPEVVFEAWHEAHHSGRLDEERLADYLEAMNFPATTRRAAVMLQLLERVPGRVLQNTLEKTRAQIDRKGEFAVISLLPGIDYKTLDKDWLVRTP